MRTAQQYAVLVSVGALAFGVAACGGSSSSSSSAAGGAATTTSSGAGGAATTSAAASSNPSSSASGQLAIAANPTGMLMFDKSSLAAKAGTVTIKFTNRSSLGHNLTVRSASGSVVGATPTFAGGTKTLKLKLKAGKYTYLCTVPGHAAAGMMGTLTVG